MTTISEQIRASFGNKTLYEILNVPRDSTAQQIKQAYRRLALIHHPDKGGNAETFKALCYVQNILTNEESRKIYDETGEAGDDDESANMEQTVEEWYNYFRALFPKLTTSSIDEFSARYKGSEEERQDILEAYEKFKGDVEAIMETVILLEEGEELRLFAILDNAIEQKEIKRYKKYTQFKDTFDEKKRSNKRSVKDINLEATEDSFSSLRDSILAKKSQKDPFESILNKYGGKSANGKSKEKLRQQYEAVPEEAFQSRKALRKSK